MAAVGGLGVQPGGEGCAAFSGGAVGTGVGAFVGQGPERQDFLDDLLVEIDIHFRIEDDRYYPALSAASSLIAVVHAEHRQFIDQLSVLLRTPPTAPTYDDEWHSSPPLGGARRRGRARLDRRRRSTRLVTASWAG